MFTARVTLESLSPYSTSRMHDAPKKPKEPPADYDERTWREKAHFDEQGRILIPRMAFKFALMDAAAYLGERVEGKGMKTWTQYFTSALHVENDLIIPGNKEDIESVLINAHANGNRKSGKRVRRRFPIFKAWKGVLTVLVLDSTITQAIFTRVFEHAGSFIGIGRFRPQNGGYNGRFRVVKVAWEEMKEAA